MIPRPHYFESIRERAARRWDQLESDPELAGPWHQLFKQVQSPRHILSELLQNADDAGATEASVRIEGHCFIFTHNGEDFAEEHFASLCRFGYSNKRALHTIGFRGIGFKSTFSLGDAVYLSTPTLSVSFNEKRFTEPRWVDGAARKPSHTEIRVPISGGHREKEVEKNLEEWLKSPVSLLFFRHIRRLHIANHEIYWQSLGPGPVPDTEWMALQDKPDDACLLARSLPEAFPPEALQEIKGERLLGLDQEAEFPPCRVEIVLGVPGRLYVVLPTGVETPLPFACNAPFIQDPARLKIKDTETSPTNRWLLERIGRLAASVMLKWVGNASSSLAERASAYGLFPDVDREDNSLNGTCAATVELAFDEELGDIPFLLTSEGKLAPSKGCVIFPEPLFEVWRPEHVATLFDEAKRPAVSNLIAAKDLEKLIHWGVVESVKKEDVLRVLVSAQLPRPETWRRLLNLWSYLAPDITGWQMPVVKSKLRIVPVQGKDVLYPASDVVRLAEKRLLQSDEDWEFLSTYLLVLNQNWSRFITEQRRIGEEEGNTALAQDAAAAQAVLKTLNLEEPSDPSKVLDRVAGAFFSQASASASVADGVRLAQIGAKLAATAGDSFRFVTANQKLRSKGHIVLTDQDGSLDQLVPEGWYLEHVLHPDYFNAFDSCTADEWRRWIASGRSGLYQFAPLTQKKSSFSRRSGMEAELRRRGTVPPDRLPYVTSSFYIDDWDFDDLFWGHWSAAAKHDGKIWGRILDHILDRPDIYMPSVSLVRANQVATSGSTRSITQDRLLPAWALKFRELPCLRDTRGFFRKPAELMRRTPETESLIEVEPFVHGLLDRESTRALLDLLGVRSTPTGPARILDCLRALAEADKPPIADVEKWYRRLDQLIDACSTADLAEVKETFRKEKILLTEEAGWAGLSEVYLQADEEDVPGAHIVRASVRDLSLWRKLGIAERPTADLAVAWLKTLPSGQPLSQDEARRVRSLLGRHAGRIWQECGRWLNLAREWVPVSSLKYALTMQTLTEYSGLHDWVRQKTADLQRLTVETTEVKPFCDLQRLASCIEERFEQEALPLGTPETHPWLTQLGKELQRIRFGDEAETQRVRWLGTELANTIWQSMQSLQVVPYIDGVPAGLSKSADVVWLNRILYVANLAKAKQARLVPERLGKAIGRLDLTAALNYCFRRPVEDVIDYMEENFDLDEITAEPEAPDESSKAGPAATGNEEESQGSTNDATQDQPGVPDLPGGEPETENGNDVPGLPPKDKPHVPPQPKPEKPSIMERFAKSRGFRRVGADRFAHLDGRIIVKAEHYRGMWVQRGASGETIRQYWPKDHCLEQEPLELDFALWELCDQHPEMYALVLVNPNDDPIELLGRDLRRMREAGELVLHPASYRLRLQAEATKRRA